MRLSEGLSTMMFTDKHTGELFVRVATLLLCKHTKRKHRLIKLLSALERARAANQVIA